MKKGIHPLFYFTKVMMTDGSTYTVKSSIPRQGFWKLDQDNKSHPYWFGPSSSRHIEWQEKGQRAKFKKRFGFSS